MSHSKVVVKDHGMDGLFARIKKIKHASVKVGVLSDDPKGAVVHPGRGDKKPRLTVAQIAAVLHYGTRDGRIPPRPFLTKAFDEERDELAAMGARLIIAVAMGKLQLDRALNMMGAKLAFAAKAQITAGMEPPNAPGTIRRKLLKGKSAKLFAARSERDASLSAAREVHRQWKAGTRVKDFGGIFKAIGQEQRRLSRQLHMGKVRNARLREKQNEAAAKVKPLIDTGRLLGAITWMIEGKGHGNEHE